MKTDGFNFWSQYQKAVEKMLKDNEDEMEVSHTCHMKPHISWKTCEVMYI